MNGILKQGTSTKIFSPVTEACPVTSDACFDNIDLQKILDGPATMVYLSVSKFFDTKTGNHRKFQIGLSEEPPRRSGRQNRSWSLRSVIGQPKQSVWNRPVLQEMLGPGLVLVLTLTTWWIFCKFCERFGANITCSHGLPFWKGRRKIYISRSAYLQYEPYIRSINQGHGSIGARSQNEGRFYQIFAILPSKLINLTTNLITNNLMTTKQISLHEGIMESLVKNGAALRGVWTCAPPTHRQRHKYSARKGETTKCPFGR